VPVDAFWSITVYNEHGLFTKNALGAYAVNNITAKRDADGSVTVEFGGCDGKTQKCLPIFKCWDYMVRLYRPRAAIFELLDPSSSQPPCYSPAAARLPAPRWRAHPRSA
jgi:hypothetical protein